MKRKMIFIIGAFALCVMSCNHQPQDKPGLQEVLLIQFNDSSYKNYILTNNQGGYFASTPYKDGVPHGCWETMKGRNPYISLSNNYLIVDWRWTISWNNLAIIFVLWQERESWTQHWDTIVPHVYNPIRSVYSFSVKSYDAELGIRGARSLRHYPYITNYFTNDSHQSASDMVHETSTQDLTKGMTLDEVEAYYDAVYAEIAEQLDSAIARGQFPLDYMEGYSNQ